MGDAAMSFRRLRVGELLALAGAICVIASLFVRSYRGPSGMLDGWDTFDVGVVALLIAAVAGLATAVTALTERSMALPVATAVWCVPLALIATVAAVVRLLDHPGGATGVCIGSWLALVGALAILVGAWLALRDERPSLYPPAMPQPRPRP
jgi:hypothetical protein